MRSEWIGRGTPEEHNLSGGQNSTQLGVRRDIIKKTGRGLREDGEGETEMCWRGYVVENSGGKGIGGGG